MARMSPSRCSALARFALTDRQGSFLAYRCSADLDNQIRRAMALINAATHEDGNPLSRLKRASEWHQDIRPTMAADRDVI
jgi:hypothetical protein